MKAATTKRAVGGGRDRHTDQGQVNPGHGHEQQLEARDKEALWTT